MILLTDPPVPYADISERLGIPVGSIGPTRARALEQLRNTPAMRALIGGETRLMTEWSDDDELMAALAEAVAEGDAVTDRRRADAQAAFTWRTVDAELMELLHDSALEAGAAVRSAGETTERVLSFGAGELTLELELDGDVVIGQVLPGQLGTVALQRIDAEPAHRRHRRAPASSGSRASAPGLARFVVTRRPTRP